MMRFVPILAAFANPALMQPICCDDLHASLSRAGILALRAELVSRLSRGKPSFRDNSHDLAYRVTELSSYPYQRRVTTIALNFYRKACLRPVPSSDRRHTRLLRSRSSGVKLHWLRLCHLQYRLADLPHDVHFATLAVELERDAILAVN